MRRGGSAVAGTSGSVPYRPGSGSRAMTYACAPSAVSANSLAPSGRSVTVRPAAPSAATRSCGTSERSARRWAVVAPARVRARSDHPDEMRRRFGAAAGSGSRAAEWSRVVYVSEAGYGRVTSKQTRSPSIRGRDRVWREPTSARASRIRSPFLRHEPADLVVHLRQRLRLGDDREEVRVAAEARDDVLMQVGGDPGPGHGALVHAEVEAGRARHTAEGAHGLLREGGQLPRLRVGEVRVVGHVPVRAHEQVPRVVGVEVE